MKTKSFSYYPHPLQQALILALLSLNLWGCKGSDTPAPATNRFFGGQWNVNYDVLVDECGLVPEEANAFSDTQQVDQSGDTVVVTSTQLSPEQYVGTLREDDSFEAEATSEGDLFGDGINCRLSEALSYLNQVHGEVSSLYDLRLKCDDGFYCVSALRGSGVKAQEEEETTQP